ncbi:MAG TPA: response regulator transcription factor [Acidimicrobiales bacterium]|nr:response regulator transcription factor [Acidimicrobiales bacterium]
MHETTVAIVDTHPVLRDGLTACLAHEPDIRVVGTASSLSQVPDLVATSHPEVVVLDADLDDTDATNLIPRLKALQHAPAVVLLTCRDDAEAMATAMRMGASACVLKVAPVQDLVSAVRWAGRGEMWISPPLIASLFAELRSRSTTTRPHSLLASLTERELQILELLVEGLGHQEIADRLHLAVNTVRTHTRNIQLKLNVHSNLAAVSVALDAGLRPK